MPQASDELRDLMGQYFGDKISDAGPAHFLEEAGYREQQAGVWKAKPGVRALRDMTRKEFDCLLFLVHEWDHSGQLIFDDPAASEGGSKS